MNCRHHIADVRILDKIIQDAGINTYIIDKQKYARVFRKTSMRFVVNCDLKTLYPVLDGNKIEYRVDPKDSEPSFVEVYGPKCGSTVYIDTLSDFNPYHIREELMAALKENWAAQLLQAFRDNGLLEVLFPELHDCVGLEGGEYHNETIFDHLIHSLIAAHEYSPILKLAVLLHDVGKPSTYKIEKDFNYKPVTLFNDHARIGAIIANNFCHRIKLHPSEIDYIIKLVQYHMFDTMKNIRDDNIKELLDKVGEDWRDLFLLKVADYKGNPTKKHDLMAFKRIEKLRIKVEKISQSL